MHTVTLLSMFVSSPHVSTCTCSKQGSHHTNRCVASMAAFTWETWLSPTLTLMLLLVIELLFSKTAQKLGSFETCGH